MTKTIYLLLLLCYVGANFGCSTANQNNVEKIRSELESQIEKYKEMIDLANSELSVKPVQVISNLLMKMTTIILPTNKRNTFP